MTNKLILLFFCYCVCGIPNSFAADKDTVVVRDLSHDWYFYNADSNSFLPLVDKEDFNGKTIHFDIDAKNYVNDQLRIVSRRPVSIFINGQLIDIVKGIKYYGVDSLNDQVLEDRLHFTIYSKDLNPFETKAAIVNFSSPGKKPLEADAIIIREREPDSFRNFTIVAVILVFGFLAALINYFPKALADFFKISKTFSFRDSDETLFKSRPLSRTNLLFYGYLSLLIALVLILLINQLEIHLEAGLLYPDGFWDGLWKWVRLSGIIMSGFFVKYLLINNMSALFYLRGFSVSHYFNYVRMMFFIFTAAIIVILFSCHGFEISEAGYYKSLFYLVFVLLGICIFILFFKLLNTGSYKTLHLFSYLCATEVIPYVILLYLRIDQPF